MGATGLVGATAGPSGVGLETANRAPSPGAIASEVEVPVTVWNTAVLTAAAPITETPATANRRRRAAPSPSVSRIHAAPSDAALGSTQVLLPLPHRRLPGEETHGARAPAQGPGAVY